MHTDSLAMMETCLFRLTPPEGANVLDVGSYDVNGTYRPLVEARHALYTGLDIRPGPNVDVVAEDNIYMYPFPDQSFDAVICGNMLHNTTAFWNVIPEMVRVLRPGGLLAIVAPTWNKPHSGKYPLDCWRFMRDGLRYLFNEQEVLGEYNFIEYGMDICGSAIRQL